MVLTMAPVWSTRIVPCGTWPVTAPSCCLSKLHDVAVFDVERIGARYTVFDSNVDVVLLGCVVAVNRHEELGLDHVDHFAVLILTAVAGNVQRPAVVYLVAFMAENVHAFFEQVVYHDPYQGVITAVWNRRAGHDYRVLLFEVDVLVVAGAHTHQSGVRFALAAGTDHHDFVIF